MIGNRCYIYIYIECFTDRIAAKTTLYAIVIMKHYKRCNVGDILNCARISLPSSPMTGRRAEIKSPPYFYLATLNILLEMKYLHGERETSCGFSGEP